MLALYIGVEKLLVQALKVVTGQHRIGIYALASGCWVYILALQIPSLVILYRQVIY